MSAHTWILRSRPQEKLWRLIVYNSLNCKIIYRKLAHGIAIKNCNFCTINVCDYYRVIHSNWFFEHSMRVPLNAFSLFRLIFVFHLLNFIGIPKWSQSIRELVSAISHIHSPYLGQKYSWKSCKSFLQSLNPHFR